jgi:uncharacterized protein
MRALLPFLVGVAITPLASAQHPRDRPPIIDVHRHAYTAAEWTSRPPNPATGQLAPASATDHMRACLAAMERYNIVAAIVSGPLEAVETWRRGAPGRILGSPLFGRPGFDLFGRPLPALDSLRTLYRGRQLKAMAEVTAQYEGLSPSDALLDPYFALAEETDHVRHGPDAMARGDRDSDRVR